MLPSAEPSTCDCDRAQGVRNSEPESISIRCCEQSFSCSQRIFDHLLASTRPSGVTEKVLLVGQREEFAAAARARGIAVLDVTPRELADDYRIESAPLLLVVAPDGAVRYAGGYTERKQGPEIEDVELIERLLRDETTTPLPLFGCAVSERLQAILDPLGLEDSEANR